MGNYSNVENGNISYDFIGEDAILNKIKDFIENGGILEALTKKAEDDFNAYNMTAVENGTPIRNNPPRPITYSIFENYSTINHLGINIDFDEVKAYSLKTEIQVIVNFLQNLGIKGIDVDITRQGEEFNDIENYKLHNYRVVSAKAEITYTFEEYK